MSDSLVLFLERAAPGSAASREWEKAAMSAEGRIPPPIRVAGSSRSWTIEQQGTLFRDGIFAVTTDIARNRERLMNVGATRLSEFEGIPLPDVLRTLSTRTAAHLALDELMLISTRRPQASEGEIRRCRRRLDHPLLQYGTGRGAQRDVVEPWERWLGEYEDLLLRIERAWTADVLPVVTELTPGNALSPLLNPLRLVQTTRDRKDLIHEYRARLASLSRGCQRVSAEIGVVGTLMSLALVPATEALGALFLAPVIAAGSIYYLGHSIVRRFSGGLAPVALSRPRIGTGGTGEPGIDAVLARMKVAPVSILAGPRLAAVDLGCALALQLETMHASRRDDRLSAVSVTSTDTPGEQIRVVFGGPLVRTPLLINTEEACRLTDEGGEGWHFQAEGDRIAEAADEEHLGTVSVALARDDVLFVAGIRDAGTVAALNWLRQVDEPRVQDIPWVMIDARCRS
ncbi:MAG: hypothetical protein ABIZ50_01260 [Solirubrobacterales bacterium]